MYIFNQTNIISFDKAASELNKYNDCFLDKYPIFYRLLKEISKDFYFIFEDDNYNIGISSFLLIYKEDPIFQILEQINNANIPIALYSRDLNKATYIQITKNNSLNIRSCELSLKKSRNNKANLFVLHFSQSSFYINADTNILFKNYNNKTYPLLSLKAIYQRICNMSYFTIIDTFLKIYYEDNILVQELMKDTNNAYFINKPINEVLLCHHKQELIEKITNIKISYNLNRLNFKIGISFAYFIKYFSIENKKQEKIFQLLLKEQEYLTKLIEQNIINTIIHINQHTKIINIATLYYLISLCNAKGENKQNFIVNNDYLINHIIPDYIKLAKQLKNPINFNIKSSKRLEEEHDKLSNKLMELKFKKHKNKNIQLTIHNKYNTLNLGNTFHRINTDYELFQEGMIQKHCVYSYKKDINKGKCVIYTTNYKNQKYTIEIRKSKNKFILTQIRGKRNIQAPDKLIMKINTLINKSNFSIHTIKKEQKNKK